MHQLARQKSPSFMVAGIVDETLN